MPTSTGTYDTSTITYDQSSLSYDGYPAPLSGMPAVGVFVAFAGQPYEVNPAFTEISQYVRQVTIRRGRQDDLQQFPPGTAQLVLDNRDRLFDPFNDGRLATRTNLCPNPSFETNFSGWTSIGSATAPTLTQIVTDALFGIASLQLTKSGARNEIYTSPNVAATAGLTYTVSGYIKVPTGNETMTAGARVLFFDSGGAQIGTFVAGTTASVTATSGWTRVSVTATAPANAASIRCYFGQTSGGTSGQIFLLDGIFVEQSSTLGTYFDGSSTDGSWTGVPNNSTSQLKVYRRNLIPNPSFETGTTSWSATGSAPGSIAQNTFFEVYGDYSCLRSVIGDGVAYVQTSIAGNIPISAGAAYTLSAYCRTSISRNVRVIIQWRDSANTFISNAIGVLSASSTTAFTRFTVTGTAPANAVSAVAFLETNNAFIGDVIYWDAVMLEQSSSVGDYFDGSLAGAFNFGTPQWEGTANASTSVMRKFPLPSQLSPRDQIKIVANWNGTEYPLYRGYIAGWPVEYTDAGFDSTVTIDCFDGLGLMANEIVPTDWADFYTRAQNPTVYFKGDDSQGTAIIRDAISNGAKFLSNTNSATNPNFFEAPQLAPGAASKSVFAQSYRGVNLTNVTEPSVIVGDFPILSVSAWCKGTGSQTLGNNQIRLQNNGGRVSFYYNTGTVRFTFARIGISSTSNVDVDAAYIPSFGQPFHIFAIINNSSTPTVYINGTLVTTTAGVSGSGSGGSYGLLVEIGGANFQELAVWERVNFTAADVAQIYNAGAARITETTTARMQRIIDTTLWPASLESFTTSPVAQVTEIGNQVGVIPEMQRVTDSEGGEFFASKTNVLTFYERDFFATQTRCNTSQMTFTDTGVGVGYDAQGIRIDYDADRIRNDVNVRFSGGGINSNTDSTSISTFGAAEWTVETVLDSPSSANTLAARLTTLYKNPKMAIEPFMSKGQKDPSYNWPRLLALELLDRVTFKRTPATGSAIVKDLLVQSIEHRITPGEWQTVVNGSARYTNWFIVGVSLIGGDDLLLN